VTTVWQKRLLREKQGGLYCVTMGLVTMERVQAEA